MSSVDRASFNVAFIGPGGRDEWVARRLVDAGFIVTVSGCNIGAIAAAPLDAEGATAATSPAEAVVNASVVVLMVPTAEDVTSALFAPATGAAYGMAENATIILLSAVPPTVPQDIRHRLDSKYRRSDVIVVDALVSGGAKEAEAGTLSIMVSAAKVDYLERWDVHTVLSCVASQTRHIYGPLGSALKVRLLSQLLCGIHLVAAAEIVNLTAMLGLDTRKFYVDVANPGSVLGKKKDCWSWMFEDRVPKMLNYRLPLKAAMSDIERDMEIINSEAEKANLRLDLCQASHVVYRSAVKLGHEDDDDSAVLQTYVRRETAQGADQTIALEAISDIGGLLPEDEAARIAGLLADALAAVHAMADYEALLFAEGMHLCRTLKQCKQWIDILGGGAAGSTMFVKGMPRVFESETRGTGSLELLVPCREGLLSSLREVIEMARDEDQHITLLSVTEKFFQYVCDGTIKHHGRSIILVDASAAG